MRNHFSLFKLYSIGCFLALYFQAYDAIAQIGSLGGFGISNLSEKNEIALYSGRNFLEGVDLKSYDVQVAYAFHKHMAIQAGYYKYTRPHRRIVDGCQTDNCEIEYINHSFKLSIGGFYQYDLRRSLFRKNKKRNYIYTNKNHLLVDVYASYEKSINWQSYFLIRQPLMTPPNTTINFDNYHIQSNFSWNTTFIGGSFSVIYGFININKLVLFGVVPNRDNLIDRFTMNVLNPFYGIQFKLWVGTKQVKLMYAINRQTFMDNRIEQINLNAYFNNVYSWNYLKQLALQINFNAFKIKK